MVPLSKMSVAKISWLGPLLRQMPTTARVGARRNAAAQHRAWEDSYFYRKVIECREKS
jgi:hypothetical protein